MIIEAKPIATGRKRLKAHQKDVDAIYAAVEKNLDEKVSAFTATIYTEPGVTVGLSFVLPAITLRRLLPGLAVMFGSPDVSFVDYDG